MQLIVAVIAYMAIGMLWFGPLFGKKWAKLSGVEKASKSEMKKAMAPAMTVSIVSAIVQVSVLGTVLSIVNLASIWDAFAVVFVVWFAFTFSVIATNYKYSMRGLTLTLIDVLFPLVTWLAMTAVLYLW